ncbi:MAG TPA: phosphatidylserine decarboxylase [Burkholderiales bacterium]
MAQPRYPFLAREGWAHVLIVAVGALAVQYFGGILWALPVWVALVFVLQFFRDPPRAIPDATGLVVCPADGRVIAVGVVDDPYLKRQALRISVFMNVFNVHSNRMPAAGRVTQAWYRRGKFLNAALNKASEENERNALSIRTDDGHDLVVVQVAGLIARRILCYVQPNQAVARGERYGFIRFGSRVDVYLPAAARARVGLGDKVKGGSDILATFAD